MRPNMPADFWKYVDKGTPDECWNWIGARERQTRYGLFKFHCRQYKAHRFSYELAHGPIPPSLRVLHSCDNPRCVNPLHLFLGTNRDNSRDMVAKERQAWGARNHGAKLSEDDVRQIRALHAQGVMEKDLARQFHVHISHLSEIIHFKTWKYLR